MVKRYLDFRDRRQLGTDWLRSLFSFLKGEFPLGTTGLGPIVLRALLLLILLIKTNYPSYADHFNTSY